MTEMAQSHAHRMPVNRDAQPIPRFILRAAGAIVIGVLVIVGAARLTGTEPAAQPPASQEAAARMILISSNLLEGGVRVTDSETGVVIADMPMDEAGFIAGVDRALRRERAKTGADPVGPVRLVRWIDGRMSVIDPASGWQIELMGFGRDNLKAFARLLEPGATSTGSRG